ncbi:MAG: hypothetical protein ACRYF8_05285 [Janthinobacterium lividum]|jgi:DNA-binding LytR/AlgR family response regulator
MSISVLLVEDNYHKRQKITDFIIAINPAAVITEAHSFSSGSKALLNDVYDVVMLDISLPTYDKVGNESGGRKRLFGGREIARKLIRRRGSANIVFITQYDAFSDGGISLSFDELGKILSAECGTSFHGLILYDSSKSAWKDALESVFVRLENKAK